MDHAEFYARCATMLKTEHDFHEPPEVRNRLRHDGTILVMYTRLGGMAVNLEMAAS